MGPSGKIKCSDLVGKSENQNLDKTKCKCQKEDHKVWCAGQDEQLPDKNIAARKFDPAQVEANCINGDAYCASGARYKCHKLVLNSESRTEEPGKCKCSTYHHKVFCPGTKAKIQDRKFDPEKTREKCPNGNAYCAKNNLDAKAPKWEMVVDQGISSQINTPENSQAKVDSTVQEMHPKLKQEKELRRDINPLPIKDAENNLVVVKDPVATQPQVIKAHNQDVSESSEQEASTTSSKPTTTTAAPTTPTTTSTTEEDPSQVWVYLAPKFWASKEWKCCENSKYRDDLENPLQKEKLLPKIQYIKDPKKVPSVRVGCGSIPGRTATGCGCMFGDS
eukprot:CAMPEP_0172663604 /NCGR_PEP_ID=MMETSP1074-20121228/6040_1 /TAXON_ID=2916 /ORGANISM="Ceratium fusus, Strain PA161109" /LENGTH=333 /DNA_ID=CAMNT_0013479629 /DNA_START=153 /DNA_END=1150 /DNA_ORIENTATION=+